MNDRVARKKILKKESERKRRKRNKEKERK